MRKNNKVQEVTTEKPKAGQYLELGGIWGILALFVCVSIAFTTAIVVLSTNDKLYWIGAAPQVAFAAWIAIKKFASN